MIYLISILLTPFTTVLWGWTLRLLWLWFVVPLFDVPALNIPQAIGIGLTVRFATYHFTPRAHDTDTDKKDETARIIVSILSPLLTLLFAKIVLRFL